MSDATKSAPAGFIDAALAGEQEIQRLRAGLQAASGSLEAAGGRTPVRAVSPTEDQAVAAALALVHLLQTRKAGPEPVKVHLTLHGAHGKLAEMALPVSWSAELLQEIAVLLSGNAVQWGSTESAETEEIGTTDVARILGVSIPTATKVLDRGDIQSRLTPGGHRRVRRVDVESWRAKRDAQRGSLASLAQMAEQDESPDRPLPARVHEDPEDET